MGGGQNRTSGRASGRTSGEGGEPCDGTTADDDVLDLVGRLAGLLVAGGYEGTLRAEERLRAVAAAYGREAEVTVLADSAVVTVGGATRVVAHAPDVPVLARVSELKPWLAEVATGRVPAGEARRRLERIAAAPHPYGPWLRLLGVVLFSVGFGVSIQPTWQEVWMTALLGLVVGALHVGGQVTGRPGWLAPLAASGIVGTVVLVAAREGWVTGGTIELMIPVLFVFIPGDAITMAMVELSVGRITAGAARLAQSLALLGALAFGPVLAAAALGMDQSEIFDEPVAPELGAFAGWFAWVVFTVGVMLVFGMRAKDLPWSLALVLVTYGTQLLTVRALGTLAGTFAAAAVMAAICLLLGRRPGAPPPYVLYLAAFFVLTPGSHGLRGMDAWLGGDPVRGVQDVAGMFGLIAAIALGMLAAAVTVGTQTTQTTQDTQTTRATQTARAAPSAPSTPSPERPNEPTRP
ncbi:threonine/serine exporter family protein [Streptomyces sp. NPDC020807]|uniref:threonine/serine ThrE exporter family protein n=1 Tax=Streptomyces sp. NPDC020807 TaxID=3155119 RepID=UPI0033F43D65